MLRHSRMPVAPGPAAGKPLGQCGQAWRDAPPDGPPAGMRIMLPMMPATAPALPSALLRRQWNAAP